MAETTSMPAEVASIWRPTGTPPKIDGVETRMNCAQEKKNLFNGQLVLQVVWEQRVEVILQVMVMLWAVIGQVADQCCILLEFFACYLFNIRITCIMLRGFLA